MSSSPLVEEGLETPIDNFVFRQCPAEFKLKATNSKDEKPSWAVASSASRVPKASLVQISHKNGIILFPHYEKGALGYAPINNLAEKDKLSHEFMNFPGDESFIQALCLDSSEKIIYVAKGSNILYAVNLNSDDKRPLIKEKVQFGSSIVECVVSAKHELFVLLENGKILNLSTNDEEFFMEIDLDISAIIKSKFSCMSQIRNDTMAVGSKTDSEIYFINLERDEVSFKTITVPWESLGCGSGGISSIFLFEDENTLLFSCVPDDSDTDDVPLLLLENISNGKGMKFSFFFDPCASRPPRLNQFYFQTLPISKWPDNLVDLVVVGNFASPDLGVCGRLQEGGEFQTFYIDNDEGLAQLPFVNGEVTYPLGLALDLSSEALLDNLKDPEGDKYPPSPIVWVLTDTAQLCPFYLVKTDETKPFPFMISVPNVRFSRSPSSVEEISSEELESFSSEEEDEVSDMAQSKTPPQKAPMVGIAATSTPQTPSKVTLQHLASLQKSSEIKPTEKTESSGLFSFKPAPAKPTGEAMKPSVDPVAVSKPSTTANTSVQVDVEPVEPVLVKKVETMETMNVSAYQNILLAEIAATHAAMQEDIFSLKQLSLKNSLLLRQNSQKYFNSLGALETYAASLEKLLGSSDKVFLGIKDRLENLKFDLKELQVKKKSVKSTWSRIKQDNKINWDSRVKALSIASQDLFERIDRLRSFMSNPFEASKYRATLKSFVDSTQEKVQLLMAHLSNLFVCQSEDVSNVYSDLQGLSLSPSLSSESLLEQMNVLSLKSSRDALDGDSRFKTEKRNKSLLNAVKARGARLLIPNKFTPTPIAVAKADDKHLKLTAEDESLISSFISAINLTEEVPEFAETGILAKLSLEDKDPVDPKLLSATKPATAATTTPVIAPKLSEFKPAVTESKPFEFKPVTNVESKPFEFKIPETSKTSEAKLPESKPFVIKPVIESSPASTFSFSSVSSEKSTTSSAFSFKPLESKSLSESTTSPSISTNSSKSESSATTESSIKDTPKMPSIFTMASQPAAAGHESILKKESPLPTFDSLNFGSNVKEEKPEVKPFPAIFGVKPTTEVPVKSEKVASDGIESVKEESIETEKSESIKSEDVKAESSDRVESESTAFFSFSSPSISVASEEKTVPAQGFSFNFKSETSKEYVKESVKESIKEQSKETTTPTGSSSEAAPAFSFSFAPNVEKSPAQASSAATGFSITTKPTFSAPTPTAPVFGSTSMPAAPVFGSTSMPTASSAPAFGQTSFPSFGFSASAPVPAAPSGSSGFAAFAAASNQGSTGFSAFTAPQGNNGNGLTFASFLPADKDMKQQSENDGKGAPASSTFSFTGFRE